MPRDLPVTDVMTSPVVTVSPEDSVQDAVRTLVEHGFSGAPVVDADGRLVGLLDDTDLLLSEARLHAPTTVELFGAYITLPGEHRRFQDEIRHALGQTVGAVMHDAPPVLSTDARVEDVATLMLERDVSRIPIVDGDGRVVGIVTRGDLVQAIGRGA
jgi:CBS domain-containing protein